MFIVNFTKPSVKDQHASNATQLTKFKFELNHAINLHSQKIIWQ